MTSRRLLFPIFTIILLAQAPGFSQNRNADPYAHLGFKTGAMFPDIVLPEISNGKPMSVADFAGKKLIVLHFASW